MADKCRQLGTSIISILQALQNDMDISDNVERAVSEVKAMRELAETLQGTLRENSSELLADLVENELSSMDKAIEEAANMIQVSKYILIVLLIFFIDGHSFNFDYYVNLYIIYFIYLSRCSIF